MEHENYDENSRKKFRNLSQKINEEISSQTQFIRNLNSASCSIKNISAKFGDNFGNKIENKVKISYKNNYKGKKIKKKNKHGLKESNYRKNQRKR